MPTLTECLRGTRARSNVVLVIGAGASCYSGDQVTPPLGKDLWHELIAWDAQNTRLIPSEWDSKHGRAFRTDFEAGMSALRRDGEEVLLLQHVMGAYFSGFTATHDSLYLTLLRRLKESGVKLTVITTNYELLIERAADLVRFKYSYTKPPRASKRFQVFKPHGSCNIDPRLGLQMKGAALLGARLGDFAAEGRPRQETSAAFFSRFYSSYYSQSGHPNAPVMCQYEEEKTVNFGRSFISSVRSAADKALAKADLVVVVGLACRLNEDGDPVDKHLWVPMANSPGKLVIVDPCFKNVNSLPGFLSSRRGTTCADGAAFDSFVGQDPQSSRGATPPESSTETAIQRDYGHPKTTSEFLARFNSPRPRSTQSSFDAGQFCVVHFDTPADRSKAKAALYNHGLAFLVHSSGLIVHRGDLGLLRGAIQVDFIPRPATPNEIDPDVERYFDEARKGRDDTKEGDGVAELVESGRMLRRQGVDSDERDAAAAYFRDALAALNEANRICPNDQIELDIAKTEQNLALACTELGEFEVALRYGSSAVERTHALSPAFEEGTEARVSALLNLAKVKGDSGDARDAVQHLTAALAFCSIEQRSGNSSDRLNELHAQTSNNLGYQYLAVGETEPAQKYSRLAVDLYLRLAEGNPSKYAPSVVMAANNISAALSLAGDDAGALREIESALKRIEPWKNHCPYDHGRALQRLGECESRVGQYGNALESYERAFKAYAVAGRPSFEEDIASLQGNRAVEFIQLGYPAEAEAALSDAIRRLEGAQGGAGRFGSDLARLYSQLGMVRVQLEDPLGATEAVQFGLSSIQMMGPRVSKRDYHAVRILAGLAKDLSDAGSSPQTGSLATLATDTLKRMAAVGHTSFTEATRQRHWPDA